MSDTNDRIGNYLSSGGLFNPEHMEHEKVRDLLVDCREELTRLRAENVTLRNAQKACETCDGPTIEEVKKLRAEIEALKADNRRLEHLFAYAYLPGVDAIPVADDGLLLCAGSKVELTNDGYRAAVDAAIQKEGK